MSNFVELTVGFGVVSNFRCQVHCQVYNQSSSCPWHGTCYWQPGGAFLVPLQTTWAAPYWARKVGKLADICLWNPAFFGSKPEMARASHASHSVLASGDIWCRSLGPGHQGWYHCLGTDGWPQRINSHAAELRRFRAHLREVHCILQWKAVPATVCFQRLSSLSIAFLFCVDGFSVPLKLPANILPCLVGLSSLPLRPLVSKCFVWHPLVTSIYFACEFSCDMVHWLLISVVVPSEYALIVARLLQNLWLPPDCFLRSILSAARQSSQFRHAPVCALVESWQIACMGGGSSIHQPRFTVYITIKGGFDSLAIPHILCFDHGTYATNLPQTRRLSRSGPVALLSGVKM